MHSAIGPAGRRAASYAGVILFVFAAAYWNAAGGGFISDDFRWILESRIREWSDVQRLFVDTTGFYRPVIALGIAALESFAGTNPRPYGIALFLLAIACAATVSLLARSLGLRASAALLAGGVWLLNPHGINMAILWVSGLTALCLVFFGTTSALAVQHGRPLVATVLFFAALLSKEEAILLPIPLLLIAVMRPLTRAKMWILAAGLAAAEIVYFYLRSQSDAVTPGTAPSFYRFTFQPADVISNLLQYADRSLAMSALAGFGRTLQILALALPVCLLPVLKARTARWTDLMRVSRITLEAIAPSIASPQASGLLLVDDPGRRDNLANAFQFLLPDAFELYTGQRPEVWVVPVPSGAMPGEVERVPASVSLAWRYQNGSVARVPARDWVGTEALRMR